LKIEFENFLVRPLSHRMSFDSPHLRHREEAEKGETDEMIVNSSVYQDRKCSREGKSAAMVGLVEEKAKKRNERSRSRNRITHKRTAERDLNVLYWA
jgi:hypothetical protein